MNDGWKYHASRIEISRKALAHNIAFLKNHIGKEVRFSSVIKGNAYGHHIETFLPLAESLGVDHFSVFSADEAWRAWKIKKPGTHIMIMGDVEADALEWAVKEGISFYVFEPDRLESALVHARALGKAARVHIELETGLNRTGLEGKELQRVLNSVQQFPGQIKTEGLCTHLAGAESIGNHVRVKEQIRRFRSISKKMIQKGLKPACLHTACSAAALRYPEAVMDMVRIGIAQYGFWPSRETFMQHFLVSKSDPLQRIMSWKSRIMSIKQVPAGEFVGYGTSYLTTQNILVAAVPVGYAHGFSRTLSNLGRAVVGGKRVGVIGLVNMNLLMLDITDVPEAQIGDEVVLIGKQQQQEMSVSSFSELTQRLNYETLVRIPENIPRIIV